MISNMIRLKRVKPLLFKINHNFSLLDYKFFFAFVLSFIALVMVLNPFTARIL